jgi:site-specific DNA recombinase
LIDSYAEGVLEPDEFQPRITGLKARRVRLEEQRQAAVDEAEAERELTLMIGRLEEFAARVRDGLNDLDWAGKQALIRTLVRRVEIERNHVEIIFRVPPPAPETSRPLEPPSDRETWHHCTDDQHLHCGTPGPLGRPLHHSRFTSIHYLMPSCCQWMRKA